MPLAIVVIVSRNTACGEMYQRTASGADGTVSSECGLSG